MKKIFISLIIIFLIDFVSSNLYFKKKDFWNYDGFVDHYWRISSKIYHHDLLPNINVIEPWGRTFKKKLITNSLGFRDFTNRIISKKSNKKRVLLIGDSAIEGAGYDFEFTIGGLLQNYLSEKYEVLNSAVGSYSPSIYYAKVNYLIQKGYKFDQAIVFLDPSDVIDELFIDHDENKNIIVSPINNKDKFVSLFLDNSLIFRNLIIFTDNVENLKNFFKLKYKASKKFKKSFFKTTPEDVMFYRMTHVDRSAWTFDNTLFKNYKDGLAESEKYLNKLINILKENNIEITFVLYPHPSQIVYEDLYHQPYWINWAETKNIDYITLYPDFSGENKRKIVLDTFIFGDLHWNKKGTQIVFNSIINKIDF